MRIIDRYVLTSFIKNYLISFMVLIGLYIAMDMVIHFANLTQTVHGVDARALSSGQMIWDIAKFYFFRCFLIFMQLAGIICVVAAAFTLMRFSHFNEMTALMAAGMPLLRVALSIILAGIVLNLVLLPINQELLIPRMIPELSKDYEDVHLQTVRTSHVAMMPDEKGNLFSAGLYTMPTDTTPAQIEALDIIERVNLVPVSHIRAAGAVWNARKNQWDLTGGRRVDISPAAQATPQQDTPVNSYPGTITPEKILLNLEKSYVQLLPTHRIDMLLQHPEAYGHMNLLRAKHMRFAQPIINVILLLLAIPAVLTRNPAALKTSALKCMGLTAACMGMVFLAYQLAGQPMHAPLNVIWPAIMAWVPIFIFGPVSVYMLEKIKS